MGFGDRRAADAFQAVLDGEAPARDRKDARLLQVVTALREVPDVEARPEFVASLREQLMLEAATALVPDPEVERLTMPSRRPGATGVRSRRLGTALGGFALVGAAASMAVASTHALPGDSLYPIKQIVENSRGTFAQDDAARGRLQLDRARTRLEEATALAMSDDPRDAGIVAGTLDDFTDQATDGAELLLTDHAVTGSQESIEILKDFSAGNLQALADLAPLLPADAGDELSRAATRLATIGAQASMMCPECGGAPYVGVPAALQTFVPGAYVGPDAGLEPVDDALPQPGEGTGITLPDLDSSDLPPASVTDPDQLPDAPTAGLDDVRDPLEDLTTTVTETLDGGLSLPELDVPGTVDHVTGTVDDTVGGLLGTLGQAADGTTGQVGGLVENPTGKLP